jgi:hypothetical protein
MKERIAVWKRRPKRLEKFPTFIFARRRRLLTLIGSLILFLTFVVKEGKREELKAIVGAIALAQTNSKVREDISLMIEEIEDVKRSIGGLRDEMPRTRNEKTHMANSIGNSVSREIDNMEMINSLTLDSTENLFQALPYQSTSTRNYLNSLKRRWSENKQETDSKFRSKMQKKIFDLARDPSKGHFLTVTPEDLSQLSVLYFTSDMLAKEVRDAEQDVLKDAKAQKEVSEAAYKAYDRDSTFLYVVGWLINLCGALWLGVESGTEK